MRRIERQSLPERAQAYLDDRQTRANSELVAGTLNIENRWNDARQTQTIGGIQQSVLSTLRQMSGTRERCMYCLDSHGCDIEHFQPKSLYPQHAFRWPNMLLCCTECGRFKGDDFPLHATTGELLLIDPSLDDPWQHIDFDPDTGNLTARYDREHEGFSARGQKTVDTLRLDRREALSRGHLLTFRRLSRIVRTALQESAPISLQALHHDLQEADEHGLLPWCFSPIGATVEPFNQLREHADLWHACATALG